MQISNHPITCNSVPLGILTWWRPLTEVQTEHQLSDSECGMVVVGVRLAGLNVKKKKLGFSRIIVCGVYRKWSGKKGKYPVSDNSLEMACWWLARGQSKMARLFWADRKVTQTTAYYNQRMQKCISEYTMQQTLKKIDYSSRRLHRSNETGQQKIGKALPGPRSLFCYIQVSRL